MNAYPNILQSFFLVAIIAIVHAFGKRIFSPIEDISLAMMLIGFFKCCLLFLFLLLMIRKNYMEKLEFSLKRVNINPLVASVLGVVCISNLPIQEFSFFDEATVSDIGADILESQIDIFSFSYVVLVAPIFEEIVFRGVIQRGLSERYSPVVGILVASVLFTVLHVSLIGTFLFSLFIGWIYSQTKNLLYCVIMHVAVNLVAFGMRFVIFKQYVTIESLNDFLMSNNFWIGTVLLTIFLGSLYYLYFTFRVYSNKLVNSNNDS
ncbi:CPBP family intramembrane glutamic endopeptidase [Olivibacter sp. XZL3]|uniref:CPBP family intramembrane glutamic endopeptidase n=1 Tax=Olivibacter sp. XZL3 TaxID=1735116 RepID=UPI0010667345|nr:type II CAAX endopeptidase family protein [Olivibacter sp. XZL3]